MISVTKRVVHGHCTWEICERSNLSLFVTAIAQFILDHLLWNSTDHEQTKILFYFLYTNIKKSNKKQNGMHHVAALDVVYPLDATKLLIEKVVRPNSFRTIVSVINFRVWIRHYQGYCIAPCLIDSISFNYVNKAELSRIKYQKTLKMFTNKKHQKKYQSNQANKTKNGRRDIWHKPTKIEHDENKEKTNRHDHTEKCTSHLVNILVLKFIQTKQPAKEKLGTSFVPSLASLSIKQSRNLFRNIHPNFFSFQPPFSLVAKSA